MHTQGRNKSGRTLSPAKAEILTSLARVSPWGSREVTEMLEVGVEKQEISCWGACETRWVGECRWNPGPRGLLSTADGKPHQNKEEQHCPSAVALQPSLLIEHRASCKGEIFTRFSSNIIKLGSERWIWS